MNERFFARTEAYEVVDARGWNDTLNKIEYSNAAIAEDNRNVTSGQFVNDRVGAAPVLTSDLDNINYICNDDRRMFETRGK